MSAKFPRGGGGAGPFLARSLTLLSYETCFMMFYSGAFFYVEGRTRHILELRQVSCERLLITHLIRL